MTQFLKNNDFESTHVTHMLKNNDSESTHATHFLKTEYESTQATLDQNWAHERYRQLRLYIEICRNSLRGEDIFPRECSHLVMNYVMVPARTSKTCGVILFF